MIDVTGNLDPALAGKLAARRLGHPGAHPVTPPAR